MAWDYIIQGFSEAIKLIDDPYVIEIALRSIKVSGMATLIAVVWSLPLSVLLGLRDFPGKWLVKTLINGLMGVPTVIWGLVLYLMFVPLGPLGSLGLLYTEMGISIGQALLITPIIMSIVVSSLESIEGEIRELALTLGADEIRASLQVVRESIGGIVLAIIAAFNRAISELGIALMIGGNIYVKGGVYNTRVLTTAIQMYTVRAEVSIAIALGIILMGIVLTVNLLSNFVRKWLA
ncbi:Binding-protein-dependent transport systems inner membrane component [Thermococcus onnurineus NA1]|uniref:Binding-protein-dependent transport systems inner membrane component n=1 Tax=Thermococcus onnurineus (strain NA1) TaxID=523850 RepID=B6YSG6_THEON|nr:MULTISPECIES: ABC transporter permease [Thermococcus]ACJ15498.1 Binding-protein-dependent transport systems inner membrane component [Thermococcus onnurineus NA1]NJE47173.1 ABC transporter permease subunit [Thermococcus sp. GR7]NJE78002.1 ABC transporter permease subunit [Thermococcus sp. GR4]NJF22881.1 ABC transporter permease subunit [Thermococcus sp. GR5]